MLKEGETFVDTISLTTQTLNTCLAEIGTLQKEPLTSLHNWLDNMRVHLIPLVFSVNSFLPLMPDDIFVHVKHYMHRARRSGCLKNAPEPTSVHELIAHLVKKISTIRLLPCIWRVSQVAAVFVAGRLSTILFPCPLSPNVASKEMRGDRRGKALRSKEEHAGVRVWVS